VVLVFNNEVKNIKKLSSAKFISKNEVPIMATIFSESNTTILITTYYV
jgi:hypothetical protein